MKRLRIMTVCGFGLGSSMILKITLDGVLKENGISAETFCADATTAIGEDFDVVLIQVRCHPAVETKRWNIAVDDNSVVAGKHPFDPVFVSFGE